MHDLPTLLSQLVAIDSINPDLVPGGAGEGAIAQCIAEWSRQAGLDVQIVEPVAGRPSVIAIARGSGGGQTLLLNAHTDTVGVAGMTDPLTPRIVGDRLYGRGAYDMKAGLAAVMVATAAARERGLRGDVIMTAVSDEENASIGTTAVLEQVRADAAIVTEPTALDLCVAHKGFVWLTAETQGRAAHGSLPHLGIDAIAKMGPVLTHLAQLDRDLRAAPSHPLLGSGSIHASLIKGGQEWSSYPDRCTLNIERRTVPGENAALVEEQVRACLAQIAAADPEFQATLELGLVREPFTIAAEHPLVQLLLRQISAAGHEPTLTGGTGWMDAALISDAGIPTVVFGPGGEGAHATEEWADLPSTARCAAVLLAVAEEFCA